MSIFKEHITSDEIVDFLNDLAEKNLFEQFEHYSNGEWLDASVLKSKTEEKLKTLILDIDKYRQMNNRIYQHSINSDEIGLSYLVDQADLPIKYCHIREEYYLG